MTQPKLKVGQVGLGQFGAHRRHTLRSCGLFELIVGFDLDALCLQKAANEDGFAAAGSYDELLETPGLEAVVICTGAGSHAALALQAMERGLAVFVEKPLCSTPQEMHALLEAQKRLGTVVGVGHADHRHSAMTSTMRRLISSGELGTIATFEKTTAHSGGLIMKPGEWRTDPDKNPGGMLFQCGVHAVHELMFHFGPIREIYATMRSDVHTSPTADVALCHITFASGLIGSLNAYHVTPYRHTFNVFGTRANLYRDDRGYSAGASLVIQHTYLDGKEEAQHEVEVTGPHDPVGNLRSFYEAVQAAKRGDKLGTQLLYPSLQDGARAVAVIFAAAESAKTGRAEKVEQIAAR